MFFFMIFKPFMTFMCCFWKGLKPGPYFFRVIRCVVSLSTRAFEYTSGK